MPRLWRVLRWLKYLPQRLAHPIRRARALRLARRHGEVTRLTFVCLGNVCRSPYAAERARQRNLAADVISRGFIGPHRTSPDAALRVAAARGLSLESHRSRLLDATEIRDGELILVMNPQQRRDTRALAAGHKTTVLILGDFDPAPIARREIPDPWERPDAEFDASYARIDRCLDALASAIHR